MQDLQKGLCRNKWTGNLIDVEQEVDIFRIRGTYGEPIECTNLGCFDLARDYERLPETLAGLHYLAFVILMLKKVAEALI
jgi:hypothetical protein